jgi:peptide/nickel transport system substrate-binding protein
MDVAPMSPARWPRRFAWGLLLPLLVGACSADSADHAVGGPPTPGGTAVVAVLGEFESLNPVLNTAAHASDVIQFMLFTPLVRHDEHLRVRPYLAESWDETSRGVVFHLRRDVRWHDGEPVTAEDVRFTFELAKNSATASLLGATYLGLVSRATVLDNHTIRFDYSSPHAQSLESFVWAPVPRHLLEGVPAEELARHPFNQRPVGSGPFRLASRESGQSLTLEANPDFPAALGGRPFLDRLVYRIIPEPTTMLTELMTGSVDVACCTLTPDQAREIERHPRLHLHQFPSREFAYVGWNHERELFSDPRVRRALTMAIDRDRIIQGLLDGQAAPSHGIVPPWHPLHTEDSPLPYDPEAAIRLLAEAGWEDPEGVGVLSREGEPFRFTLMTNSENRLRQDIATVLQRQLRQVGVLAEVRTVEFQTMVRQHRARDYDAVVAGWALEGFRVDPAPLFSCAEARREGSANRAGYCSPAADRLMAAGARETDPPRARAIWAELEAVLQRDQPVTFLYWAEDRAGVGPRLQGVHMDVRSKFVNVQRWWIAEERRR